jgi:flagellar biosynthesis protein FlhF
VKIKRFFAKDMRTALKEVKETLGSDAVIMSNKKLADGIELVAAIDERDLANRKPATPEPSIKMPINKMIRKPPGKAATGQPPMTEPFGRSQARPAAESAYQQAMAQAEDDAPADSLAALLKRQNGPATQRTSQSQSGLNRAFMESEAESEPVVQMRQQGAAVTDINMYKDQMQTMQNEMQSIRKILTHQVSGLMWQDMERREPTRAFLVTQLRKMGLSDQVADQLACFIPDGLQEFEAWNSVIEMLHGQLNTTNNEILNRGGIFSLIGPTGVGKTTTVAKLAARFAQKHGADQVGLVTTDTFRIGAHEQLSTFGKIIGCPVKVAKNAEDLANVLFQLRNRKLILIDTAGMSQRDIRLCEQLTTLMKNSRVKIKSYLVLSATVQYNVLQETVTHFKRIPLAGCIFTKIDECLSLGEIISIAIQNGLPIGYITNGQRVPEDIDVADGGKIIEQAEQMLKQNTEGDYQWHSEQHTQAVGMYD